MKLHNTYEMDNAYTKMADYDATSIRKKEGKSQNWPQMIKVKRGSCLLDLRVSQLCCWRLLVMWDVIPVVGESVATIYQMVQNNSPGDLNLQLYLSVFAPVSSNYLEQAILFQTDGKASVALQ